MILNVAISIGTDDKLKYKTSLFETGTIQIGEAIEQEYAALKQAYKAIEEAIAKANDTLEENGLTAKLADSRYDEHGNLISL